MPETGTVASHLLPLREDECYRAVQSRDSRFDGWFVGAVHTTGIYCRPSCPAVTPKRQNMSFFPTAAAAQQRGFRACKRCRPDASPGSPEWNVRADVVARAMRLIADGVIDREGVTGLAGRLGYSTRHLTRVMTEELGAGPLAIARAQRAQSARVLIETSSMTMTEIAFAAGFASVRQFNDTVREVYAVAPTDLRRSSRALPTERGHLQLRLPYRPPFESAALFEFIGTRAVAGVETWNGVTYRRSLRLPHGSGIVALTPAADSVTCQLRLESVSDVQAAVQRCRRLLDLDADPTTVDAHLGADPLLEPLVDKRPGLRSPGAVDGAELLVRAVLGQQVSVAGARTAAARCVALVDDRVAIEDEQITHLFPSAGSIAAIDPAEWKMPRSRALTLQASCAAVADGRITIDPGADRARVVAELQALRGIGPWTAGYVALRALGDPDTFLPTDLGVRHALELLGADASAAPAATLAERWRPWRSYALHHLWTTLGAPR